MTAEEPRDKLIAKIQYFADIIEVKINEMDSLTYALNDEKAMLTSLKKEISIYQEILEIYNNLFKDILYR